MKKIFLYTGLLSMAIAFNSCKQSAGENAAASTAEATADAATPPSPVDEGKSLVEGADCLSCHKVDAKLVGPSYQEIAAKYTEADVDQLAQKIIDGGKGVWGEVPMTPHAGMSKENAQKMVKYILSLKQ